MSQLISAIEKRRAYRALSEEQIPEEALERILTAGTYAPSCANFQPWRFVVIDDEGAREKVHSCLPDGNYWARKAPLYILAVTRRDLDCDIEDRRMYALYDTGFAVMNMMLQATEEGLIAHPMAGFDDTGMKQQFGIPKEYVALNLIAFAYPGDESHLSEKHLQAEHSRRSRKPREQVISHNGWNFET
jgi:nitroreductase